MGEGTVPVFPTNSQLRLWMDRRAGRRLGKQGLPNLEDAFHVTSPWLRQRRAELRSYVEEREKQALVSTLSQREWLNALPPRMAFADEQVRLASRDVGALNASGPSREPRLGEDLLDPSFIQIRREREYAKNLLAAEQNLREAHQRAGELEAIRLTYEQQVEDAEASCAADVERAMQMMQQRWNRYIEGILDRHPYPDLLRSRLPSSLMLLTESQESELL